MQKIKYQESLCYISKNGNLICEETKIIYFSEKEAISNIDIKIQIIALR
jgi:hypothetical protein